MAASSPTMADPANDDRSTLIPTANLAGPTERSSKTSREDAAVFFETQKEEFSRIMKIS